MVIWIIGLAGAGKTTIAKALMAQLKKTMPGSVMVDGDMIREVMGGSVGYTLEDRRQNGWRMCRMSKYLEDQDLIVVCATLSQFHEQQDWNRENFKNYFEVYLDVDMDVLINRDQKGLYSQALAGKTSNVVGVDMPFPAPISPDLTLNNSISVPDFTSHVERILGGISRKYPELSFS